MFFHSLSPIGMHVKWDSKSFGEDKPTGTYTLNLRFPGQYFDIESGFSYNINRYYNPTLGRYMQSDPIGLDGGENSYLYADANPLVKYDTEGLFRKINLGKRIKTWQQAEKVIRKYELKQGRILKTSRRTYAMHNEAWYYIYGREYDAITKDSRGRTNFVEVKYRNRYIKYAGRFAKILKAMEANTARQISFYYEALAYNLDITLSGGLNEIVKSGSYLIRWYIIYQDGKGYEFNLSSELMDIVTEIFIW